ncbi:LysR family transcriptional regulator [Oceanobacillus jeddahense]|uniref:LysR family transcriptional regulator n=1 Tax=Oceanobacillus jeddahense TaxID=1462527 RepID=UPI0005962A8A|nr:LysR family transcriptional regulator [Oceanobacillus jeddahense]
MDIKQLSTFQVASETLNFTKSAEILNYAQSSVTSQIKSLETELGVNLFDRLGNKLVLTTSGEKFKRYSDTIISQYHSAMEEINFDKHMKSTITVGATESQCTYKLPDVLKELKMLFPNIGVVVKPLHRFSDIQSQLYSGEIDFAFMLGEEGERNGGNLEISKLSTEKLVLVASPENSISQMNNAKIQDLTEETIILTEKGCSYRNLLENILQNKNINFDATFEITNIETLKNCVKTNLGIALLPYGVVKKEMETGELKRIQLAEEKDREIYHFISWHKDKKLTPILNSFISVSERIF